METSCLNKAQQQHSIDKVCCFRQVGSHACGKPVAWIALPIGPIQQAMLPIKRGNKPFWPKWLDRVRLALGIVMSAAPTEVDSESSQEDLRSQEDGHVYMTVTRGTRMHVSHYQACFYSGSTESMTPFWQYVIEHRPYLVTMTTW